MSVPPRNPVAFLLGAALALTLATLLVRERYALELSRQTIRLQTLLELAGNEIGTDLERGAPGHGWHPWRLENDRYHELGVAAAPSLTESTLQRSLASQTAQGRSMQLLGPFATPAGRDALVIARAEEGPKAGAAWSGSWKYVDDVMSGPHVTDVVRQGYRLQLFDLTQQAALYQSDHDSLGEPVAVTLRFGGAHLELRAAPRDGWVVAARLLSPSVLVLLAVIAWLSYELRQRQALQRLAAGLEETEGRRKHLNEQYGKALGDIASLESRLQIVSLYDSVTGLANRSFLLQRIEANLDSMRQGSQSGIAVLVIGFDHMHHITNSFGSEFASRVLVIAAERLEFVLPSRDLLFRTGDFQLAAVLPNGDAVSSAALAHNIVAEAASPIALDGHTFMLHPAIGIAISASGYEYAETLLDHATAAFNAVLQDAPDRHCLFDSTTAQASVTRLQLEVDLDRAFVEGQFVLEYQPVMTAAERAVAGFEALIRWNHPTEGKLAPGRFLPVVMQAGMSHRLNEWVFREAVRQVASWRAAGHRELFVNFNLSAEAFLRPQLADEIGAVLLEFDLPGEHLIIELTESTLVQDIRGAARTLQRLSELGVRAWLDDFGTGYSSLSHLRNLPLRGVKIDRSFIEHIVVEARDFGVVKALVDLISYLGMQSIAEGIETQEQCELLSLTGCDLYQGYYFGHSLPVSQAEALLKSANPPLRRSGSAR